MGTTLSIAKDGFESGTGFAQDCAIKGAMVGGFLGYIGGTPGGDAGSAGAGFVGAAVGGTAGFVGGSIGGLLVVMPCAVVGGAISAVGGGVSDLSERIKKLGLKVSGGKKEWSSEVTAVLMPLLASTAAAVKLGAMSEEEAQTEMEQFHMENINGWCINKAFCESCYPKATKRGRVILTFAKLWQCYPDAQKNTILEVANKLNEQESDRECIDAAWIVCGPKDPNDWLAEAKALLPKEVTDVTAALLVQCLDLKYQSERESLATLLKERIPVHSDPGAYLKVTDAFKSGKAPPLNEAGPSPAEFWKLVSLLKSSVPTPEWVKGAPIEAFLESQSEWEKNREAQHKQLVYLVKSNSGMCPDFLTQMPESAELFKDVSQTPWVK